MGPGALHKLEVTGQPEPATIPICSFPPLPVSPPHLAKGSQALLLSPSGMMSSEPSLLPRTSFLLQSTWFCGRTLELSLQAFYLPFSCFPIWDTSSLLRRPRGAWEETTYPSGSQGEWNSFPQEPLTQGRSLSPYF